METYEAFIARIRASSYIADVPMRMVPKRKQKTKLERMLDRVDADTLSFLIEAVSSGKELVEIGGEPYSVVRGAASCAVRKLAQGAEEYTTTAHGCTCSDSQYRKHPCKHMRKLYGA